MSSVKPVSTVEARLTIAIAEGYLHPRVLPVTGEVAALRRFLFTTGLCVGINEEHFRTRFCFEHLDDALRSLRAWDGAGDPPGPWIKEKGERERSNPRVLEFKGIPVRVES